MARRSASSTAATLTLPAGSPGAFTRFMLGVRTVLVWCFGIAILIGLVWGYFAVKQFIIDDPRFLLAGPPEPGVESEHFQIAGAVHASEQQITSVFLRDFGKSVYLLPLEERRRRLLAIDWVAEATVSRFWPNRIVVRIRERAPVAFVQVPAADGTLTYGLVDADGVMLDPQRATKLALPVLTGISVADKEPLRKEKVKRFLRLQSELGSLMERVSEIDVSDVDNIRIVQVIDGHAMTLMLGNQKFLQRLQNFTDNYSEIRKRLPEATVLDLRLKDRITAVPNAGEPPDAGNPPAREHKK